MYAIYFEFSKDSGAVYRALFIPATPIGASVIQPTYCYKEVSPEQARRTWNVVPNPIYELTGEAPTDVSDLMEYELGQLVGISVYMTSPLIDPDWKTVGVFPVELHASDLLQLKERNNRMPAELNSRITALRAEKGFPELPVA